MSISPNKKKGKGLGERVGEGQGSSEGRKKERRKEKREGECEQGVGVEMEVEGREAGGEESQPGGSELG